jgi:hypothetical protein
MRKFAFAILLGCLIVFGNCSWGQSQKAKSKQSEQGSGPKNAGTEQSPFVIKILPTEQAQAKPDSNKEEAKEEWFYGWGLSDQIAAIAGAAGLLQFFALIATVMIMVRNGRRQLRAYVFVNDAGLYDGSVMVPPVAAHFNEPGVVINFKNSGQTPAYKVVSWGEVKVIEPSKEDTLVHPKMQELFTSHIGAGTLMPKSMWFGRPLTPVEINEVHNNKLRIYFYGRIEYRDAFKMKRWTTFRYSYAGPFPAPAGVIFNVCEKGNSAN